MKNVYSKKNIPYKRIFAILGVMSIVMGSYWLGYFSGKRYNKNITASANTMMPSESSSPIAYAVDLFGYNVLTMSDFSWNESFVVGQSEVFAVYAQDSLYYNYSLEQMEPYEEPTKAFGRELFYRAFINPYQPSTVDSGYGLWGDLNIFRDSHSYRLSNETYYTHNSDSKEKRFTNFDIFYNYGEIILPVVGDSLKESANSKAFYPALKCDFVSNSVGSNTTVLSEIPLYMRVRGNVWDTNENIGIVDKEVSILYKVGTPLQPLHWFVYTAIFNGGISPLSRESYAFFVEDLTVDLRFNLSGADYINTSLHDYRFYMTYETILAHNKVSFNNNTNKILSNGRFSWYGKETIIPGEPIDTNIDFTSWLGTAVGGFMSFELFPGFSFGGLFLIIIAVPIAIWLLRVFAGG